MTITKKQTCPETGMEPPSLASCIERSKYSDNFGCRKCPIPAKVVVKSSALGPVKNEEKEIVALAKMVKTSPPHPKTPTTSDAPSTTIRTCNYDGCFKKLRINNTSGYCRDHSSSAPSYRPSLSAPCKTPGCKNITAGYGTTGLCRPCAAKENNKKSRTPEAKRKRLKTLKANKSKKIADCGLQNADLKPAIQKRNNPQSDFSISVDFSEHPEILNALRAEAKEEFRDIHQQALFILNHHLKGYFVGPAHSDADSR